ncbi:AAA domain-containing protein [Marinomonas sp. 15G1-11]|uniref:AAA domain-containing protein n=1 Tax=Marinomonas phaeophyticola TaxID=3004091 RepID=A0ABT4JWD2_9GAMM|nr:AAA domain-containing protein [Marinomonas sp. 15G1-11]MCZ2722387.1 AAA domain-containing protein [Marinomonas sp. 15G1-11]
MQFNEFPYFTDDLINLTSNDSLSQLQTDQPVQMMEYNGLWLLQQADLRITVACAKIDEPQLTSLMRGEQTRWLLTKVHNKTLQLQYMSPVEALKLDLTLSVDALIADDLFTKNEIRENSIDLARTWLYEHFVVEVISANGTNPNETKENWLTISRFSNAAVGKSFQLLGKGWRVDVEPQPDKGYLIKRITRHPRRDSNFSLLIGSFLFADISVAAVLDSGAHRAILDAALRNNGSYLELWNLYNDKEWGNALKTAEMLKALRFTHAEPFEDGRVNRWRIWPKSTEAYKEFRDRWVSQEIPQSDQVDLANQPPDWSEELSTEAEKQQQGSRGNIRFEDDYLVFTSSSDKKSAIPRFDENGKGGWLYLSLAGQRVAGNRRVTARQTIDSGKRMPQLKWLLEGSSVPFERRRTIKGITPYAKETFKGGKPTDKQLLALETALNTPDIALIIGPPGTGKTQVIAALQRRLAEEFENQNISGQVLVSSFQHDAVDNALDRSQVFDLPATRVGGKKGAATEDGFSRWIDDQATHLKEQVQLQYEEQPVLQQLDEVVETMTLLRMSQYSSAQHRDQLQHLLKQLRALDSSMRVPARLISDLEDYVKEQCVTAVRNDMVNTVSTLRGIRALRTTKISFFDDGGVRAEELLRQLRRGLHQFTGKSKALLQQASKTTLAEDELLTALVELKNQLLDEYLPDYRPPELKQALDETGICLLNKLDRSLAQYRQEHKQGVAWALQELANSIDMDRQAALSTTEEYAMVVGATCQQAAGNKMASLKSVVGLGSSDIDFDTVIIDEAARANPLDLFIPMSMAKRRVILVGDDRQLPHMLEPDIENQLQEEHLLTEQQLAAFKLSLFERLRLQLEALRSEDNNPRIVMLDTQFRMHPILGDFISQQFYEAKGMDKLKTTRPASDFAFSSDFIQALGSEGQYYSGKVCQWVDVPLSEGKSSKRGPSPIRNAEAKRIATEVQRLLEADGKSLSVGVITFYAAQRDLIMEELATRTVKGIPLMVKREGQYEPSDEFKWASKQKGDGSTEREEGLRVGTVDAFQGKEFDIVLLSCVRTWHQPKRKSLGSESKNISSNDLKEASLNRMFGFLRLPNRMNVAMSRQKQMLICVGDAALATNKYAKEGVPALNAFHALCGGEHGEVR